MMLLDEIPEMYIHSIYDRGVANLERILFHVAEPLQLSRFGLLVCEYTKTNGIVGAFPVRDHFYWFGSAEIKAGDWIYLYTGAGKDSTHPHKENTVYNLYWGRMVTLFARSNIMPVLMRMDAVQMVEQPKDALQLPALQKNTGKKA